ncbi:hypothetical protein BJV74DRAFT_400624 [Russula compacta]|nr:hypothetical protein BJV74DRAFT_400624 [Russula compacta]
MVKSLQHTYYILDNDSLLKIFYHCRPLLLEEDNADSYDRISERQNWVRERWWYKLVHVCRRWRYLIFASASRLGLCLVYAHATPVTDMLAYLPLLPLIIDYVHQDPSREMTVEDEEGLLLALQHHHRVSRIRLWAPSSNLRKLVVALDREFQMLEYLYIEPLTEDGKTLILPKTFKAPHLRQVVLRNVTCYPGMSHPSPPTSRIQSAERIGRSASSSESQLWRIRDEDNDDMPILQEAELDRKYWWYDLTHICRRWRYLVLGSASYLGLVLIYTYGTPVADMLAHSPPLPLIIDYIDEDRGITAEDEEGIMVALQHRNRIRGICLRMPASDLQKLIMTIDDEFPMLECVYIEPLTSDDAGLILPKAFQAPHLRYLALENFAFPIGSPLLTAALGLVTLSLERIPYLPPSTQMIYTNSSHGCLSLRHLGLTFACHSPIVTLRCSCWIHRP